MPVDEALGRWSGGDVYLKRETIGQVALYISPAPVSLFRRPRTNQTEGTGSSSVRPTYDFSFAIESDRPGLRVQMG